MSCHSVSDFWLILLGQCRQLKDYVWKHFRKLLELECLKPSHVQSKGMTEGLRVTSSCQYLFPIPRDASIQGLRIHSGNLRGQLECVPEDIGLPFPVCIQLLPASQTAWYCPVVVCAHHQKVVCQPRLDPHWQHAFCWTCEKPPGPIWLGFLHQLRNVPSELPGKKMAPSCASACSVLWPHWPQCNFIASSRSQLTWNLYFTCCLSVKVHPFHSPLALIPYCVHMLMRPSEKRIK